MMNPGAWRIPAVACLAAGIATGLLSLVVLPEGKP